MLADILGFDDLSLMIELLSHREEIIRPRPSTVKPEHKFLGMLHTRQEREEALRRQDYEHKHASLAPSLNREGPRYPHVYKSHEAGNTLNAAGRKYALPVGSERKEHEVIHLWFQLCEHTTNNISRRSMKSTPYRRRKLVH